MKGKRSETEAADKHNRTEIPMKGQKDVFYKTLQWAGSKIRATCYRSGTSTAVSLAMSSIHHNPRFDLNLAFPKDHKWYFNSRLSQEDRNAKAFPVVTGLSTDGFDIIKNLPIRPLSLVQGDTVWFIMRLLSLSSSTVDKCISSRAREITEEHDMRHHYEIVLGAVGRMNLLSQQQIDDDDKNDDNNLDNNVTSCHGGRGDCCNDRDEQEEEEEEEQEQEQQPFDLAANWIRCVNEKEGDADYFILRLEDTFIGEDTV